MVCNTNRSDKTLNFFKSYIHNHGVPRKIHIDQGTSFMSKDVKVFCNTEGIEIVQSPVNHRRANDCVKRTIGSLKNSILIYAREERPAHLGEIAKRALGALQPSTKTHRRPSSTRRMSQWHSQSKDPLPMPAHLEWFSNVLQIESRTSINC